MYGICVDVPGRAGLAGDVGSAPAAGLAAAKAVGEGELAGCAAWTVMVPVIADPCTAHWKWYTPAAVNLQGNAQGIPLAPDVEPLARHRPFDVDCRAWLPPDPGAAPEQLVQLTVSPTDTV
jgi:hypothetical protein